MKERGDLIAEMVNKIIPGHDVEFDGVWDSPGHPRIYQFTPRSGPLKDATFATRKLNLEAVEEGLLRIIRTFRRTA